MWTLDNRHHPRCFLDDTTLRAGPSPVLLPASMKAGLGITAGEETLQHSIHHYVVITKSKVSRHTELCIWLSELETKVITRIMPVTHTHTTVSCVPRKMSHHVF
jgi:hypothetical protein